jgi:hypothetical protein
VVYAAVLIIALYSTPNNSTGRMVLSLAYRRPAYVDSDQVRSSSSTISLDKTDASLRSGRSGASSGIPDALAFDKIINGGTCPVSLLPIGQLTSANALLNCSLAQPEIS